ncbi:baseplate J/gp47 family protein [Clostridium senegalense]|uniref:baseplate J/gp47 family protein n=1 Tax=Clostridium senegalense TaxID=1465809 RepID=UPI001C102B1A|nr:baseplate J/gp47 family protein [Clostridium senegalense]MBU5227863.1 baseplate J/gp47 family protein [Clostridium senegalense]
MEQINVLSLNETVEDIHQRMLKKAPKNVSLIEGDIFWDATRPNAEEISKMKNIDMQYILGMAFPETAEGRYLEYLGECKGVFKNPPTESIGPIKVEGKNGTIIKKGDLTGTVSTAEKESIEFEFIETKIIDDSEVAYVNAKCTKKGVIGNVLPNTITVLISTINGVKSITNEEAFKGGTDIEDEEHYRQRVIAAEQEDRLSGADIDYIRWAKEVDGVGYADCIELWNGPQTVKVLVLDKNMQPATEQLIKNVKDYIYPDKKEGENRGGKAPVGAIVTIATLIPLNINISAKFIFLEGYTLDMILPTLKEKITKYLKQIKINGVVKYNAINTIIGSYILEAEGIEDYTELTINSGVNNIKLEDQVPVLGEVTNIS